MQVRRECWLPVDVQDQVKGSSDAHFAQVIWFFRVLIKSL